MAGRGRFANRPYRPVLIRLGGAMAVLVPIVAVAIALSVGFGAERRIGLLEVAALLWQKLSGRAAGADRDAMAIVWELRLPRVLLASLVGAALSLAGTAAQGVLLNPLADPYVLGVSSGAALGAAVAILLRWQEHLFGLAVPALAFAAAVLTLVANVLLARMGGRLRTNSLLLAGVVVGSFLWAIITLTLSLAGEDVQRLLFWLMGSVMDRSWTHVGLLAPFALIGGLGLWALARDLNLLAMGDDAAHQLGVEVERAKLLVVFLAALLTAAAVSVSGIIGFVGLVVPHMVRRILGPDHRVLVPAAALAGAAFVVAADTAVRALPVLSTLGELPLGVVTALVGAPFFCYLLRRQPGWG